MQVVCIQAHGDHVPGDLVEVPDGANYSPVHFAVPGSPEALASEHAAGQATAAAPGPPGRQPSADAPAPSAPVLKAPEPEGGA